MKSEFLTSLKCRLLDSGLWVLDQLLIYNSSHLKRLVSVPKGFTTDFASVPRIPIVYACFGDRAHHEAVIHDYLYRIDSDPVVNQRDADKVFLEAMKARKKPRRIRWPMYLGVRFGGAGSFHKKKVRIL